MSTMSYDSKRKRWVVRYRDYLGIRRAPTFLDRDDAKRCLRAQEIILDSFEGIETHHGFKEASELFVADLREVSEETKVMFSRIIRLYLSPLKDLRLLNITAQHIDDVRRTLHACERQASGRIAMRLLKRIFKYAEARAWLPEKHWEWVCKWPPRLLVPARKKTPVAENPNLAHVSLLLGSSKGLARVLFHLAMLTGMRIGEILALKWSDIDEIPGFIRVNKTKKRDGTLGSPKTAAGVRHVPISSVLRAELDAFRRDRFRGEDTEVIWNDRVPNPVLHNAAYWMGVEQTRLGIGTVVDRKVGPQIRRTFKGVFKCHRFRATCAALWVRQGVPIERISAWLGHSSTAVTMEIYAYLFQEDLPTSA